MAPRSSASASAHDRRAPLDPHGSRGSAGEFRQPATECCVPVPGEIVERAEYSAMVRRVNERLADQVKRADEDRKRGRELFDELIEGAPERREELISSEPRFASYPMADRLLTAAGDLSGEDPASASELALLVLSVTARLDRTRWGRALIEDLDAQAWALLGEIWSIAGSDEAARTAFRLARIHLRQGSGDPLVEAELLFHEALGVRGDRNRNRQEALDHAARIFVQHGDLLRLGRCLARKAVLAAADDEHGAAVELLREARTVLGNEAPSEVRAELARLLAQSLLAGGASEEAWTEIARARSELRFAPESRTLARLRARLRALEGRVAQAHGLDDQAAACLEEARDDLFELGEAEEAARAHLILSELSSAHRANPIPGTVGSQLSGSLRCATARLLSAGGLTRETTMALLMVDRAWNGDA